MARWLILGALIVLAVVLLSHTSGVLDGGLLDDGAAPGETLEEALRAERAGAGREQAPGLSSATAAKAREAAQARRERARAASDGEPTGPYAIVVIDAQTLAPLDGVELRIDDMEDDTLLGATDEQGRWDSQDAGVSTLALRATHPGYVRFTGTASPNVPLEIALHPGIALDAVLVRGSGEKPVPNATVRAWDEDLGREVVATGTDAEGRFRLRAVRPNHPLRFVVQAPGLAPFLHRALFDKDPAQPWVLTMPEGNRVEGRVLGAAGRPVKSATVWLMPPARMPLAEHIARGRAEARRGLQARDLEIARTAVTVTDEEGRYAFAGVEPLRDWQPVVFASRRHVVRGEKVRFADHGETREVDIQVEAGATLKLSVRDSLGQALTHADIRILTQEGRVSLGPGDVWEQGIVTLEDLPPGRTTVRALLPGRPSRGDYANIEAGGTARIDLVFKAGGTLKGRVRNRKGEPIWQALVSWHGYAPKEGVQVRTDQDGAFHLQDLASSSGMLRVSARDLPHTRTTYETYLDKGAKTGDEPQEIVLENGTSVIGRFPGLEPGTLVHCRMLGDTASDWPLKLDEQGRFRRDGPDVDKPATFVFYLRGQAPLIVYERAPFSSGETRDLGGLAFEDTNPRKGRVLDRNKRPLHGAKVSIAESWSTRSTRTDPNGDFVMAQLPDRRIRIRIEAPDHAPAEFPLEPSSQFRRQVFRMRAGQRVIAVVKDSQGRPGAGFTVVVRPRPKRRTSADPLPTDVVRTTNGRGVVFFELPEGEYEFTALHASHPRLHATTRMTIGPTKGKRPPFVGLNLNGAVR